MSDAAKTKKELLLTAFFDQELAPEERALAEAMIRDNPDHAQLIQHWRDNGNAIRELPRYQLDNQFADRVLSAIGDTESFDDMPSSVSLATHEDARNWRMGLAAIATLAAMLLLTLFVFPLMSENSVAENSLPNANNPVVGANNPEASENNSSGNVGGETNRQPGIVTPNSSLTGRRSGQPVDPIELVNLINRPTGAEQVFWIDQGSLAVIEEVLLKNSIEIISNDDDLDPSHDFVTLSEDGVEAVFVVTTAGKMKKAIADLTGQSACTVRAFPLPSGSSVSWANAKSAAQQIKPVDLTEDVVDADEIASLDQWFGLVAEDDETRLIEYLLFVKTPTSE